MNLDETALRAAFESAPDDWMCRKSHLEIIKNAIRVYLSTITPAEVGGLVERLQDRAESYRMGGPSSEHAAALLGEAVTALTAKDAELAALHQELGETRLVLEQTERNAACELAAVKADNDRLRESLDSIGKLHEAYRQRVEAALADARKALDGLLEPFKGDDCRYDHHGYCQAHSLQEGDKCCVKIARCVHEGGKVDG